MVSPAPPSNSTLSGRTTAAAPLTRNIDRMCWRKLSCLLEVVAQKSLRVMVGLRRCSAVLGLYWQGTAVDDKSRWGRAREPLAGTFVGGAGGPFGAEPGRLGEV